jgi:Flp pilus assembly protein TadD
MRKRWPAGLAAWAYSVLMLAPVSGLIHAGYQLAHDRYSYVSGLGFALLLGAGVAQLLMLRARIRPSIARAAVAAAMIAIVLLAVGTWNQTKIWRNSYALWTAAVAADPACSICYASLGNTFVELGRVRDAEAAYRQSIALRPDRAPVYTTLGMALGDQGRFDEAEAAFRKSRELDPRFVLSSANLAVLYERQGRYEEAAQLLREVYAAKPNMPNIRPSLARVLRSHSVALSRAGKKSEALAVLREAEAISPMAR